MTAATSGRSSGASVSFSTIDAMISTSYGVRFFDRAYARFSFDQLSQKATTWSFARSKDVVVRRKSYVAGNRKPSRFVRGFRPKHGTAARAVAITYARR